MSAWNQTDGVLEQEPHSASERELEEEARHILARVLSIVYWHLFGTT
jgi:hypothetical protein